MGFTAGQLNPAVNPLAPIRTRRLAVFKTRRTFSWKPFPLYQQLHAFNLTNNVTKTMGSHTFKAGIMIDATSRARSATATMRATLCSRPMSTILDTGYAYSNSAMGVFTSYTERPPGSSTARQHAVEWFAQDLWRVTRRLTLEYGMRFIAAADLHARMSCRV